SRAAATGCARVDPQGRVDWMVAAHAVRARERAGLRPRGTTLRGRVVATRMEPAAGGRPDQARHLAADVADLAVRGGHAGEEPARVGVRRPREERVGRGFL